MRRSSIILILVLMFLSSTSLTLATPSVFVELSHGTGYKTHGDSLANDFFPFHNIWLVYMKLESPDVVTGPYVEFTTDSNFVNINPWPTSADINSPSVFVWDDPNRTLDSNLPETGVYLTEYVDLDKPGFVASRTVNTPVISSNSVIQTVDFTLEFKDALPADVNLIRVKLGSVGPKMVTESIISQNDLSPYWQIESDGVWVTNPQAIPGGLPLNTEYNFQAQIQCTKKPDYEGVTIYHKPKVSVIIADWQQLLSETGTSTTLTHPPESETALFQLNETVNWDRNVASNRKGVYFETISVQVDSNGLEVDKVELSYGERYDVNNAYRAGIEVECKNVILAEMTTPTDDRTWPLMFASQSYTSGGIRLNLWLDYLTSSQLTDLGITSGIYKVDFYDHLGGTLRATSSSLTLDTPTQIPHITSPALGDVVEPRTTICWNSVSDPDVDEIRLLLMSHREYWDTRLSPNYTCYAYNLNPRSLFICDVLFCDNEPEVTPEGVSWNTMKCNVQRTHFSTSVLPGDFDIDDKVNFDDLDFLTSHWLDTGCNDSSGDESGWCYGCDIDKDSYVNFLDFAKLAEYWLYD